MSAALREAGDARGVLVMVAWGPRPDMVYFHTRVAHEIPELETHSVFTRNASEFNWVRELPPEINASSVARGYDPARVEQWWGAPLRDWVKGAEVLRYIQERDVRAVVLNGYSDLTCIRVLLHCRKHGIPVFQRGDANSRCEPPGSATKTWLKGRMVSWFLRRCDGIMPFGRFGVEFYTKYGGDPDRVYLVPAVPDFGMFESVPPSAVEAFLAEHDLDPKRKRLFFCGRLIPLKRVDLLVDAFARIAAERPDWDLVVAGSGPLRAALGARVPAVLTERVHWLGNLDWETLPPVYHACHVMVLPSEIENWGVVVLEAMASGQVVVASDIAQAAHEICRDGISGRLFRSGDLDGLASALREVTDPDAFDGYRQAVPRDFAAWRERCDPVDGLRKALRETGVLPGDG